MTKNSIVKAARIREGDIGKLEEEIGEGTFSKWVKERIDRYSIDIPYEDGRDLENFIILGDGTPREFFEDLLDRLDSEEFIIENGKLKVQRFNA
jgi:hypothetical protein